MKRRLTIMAAAVMAVAAAALLSACGGSSTPSSAAVTTAPATTTAPAVKQAPLKLVTVAMHDPGCHWFSAGGKFTKKMSVSGPVALLNHDETTLKVAGQGRAWQIAVGKRSTLPSGSYRITMVGQAPDDNTLRLAVTSSG